MEGKKKRGKIAINCHEAGGAVAQSVESATPGEAVPGSIPAVAARSLLVGTSPRYILVVDEDVKKPTKQTNKKASWSFGGWYH